MSTPLVRSLFWLTVSEILFNLSGYLIHAVTARVLGPADYGRYALVVTLTTVIVILIGNGIPTAMSKYLSEVFEKHPEKIAIIKRHGIRLQVLLMGAVTVIFFLLAPAISKLLGDPTLTPLFQLSSLIIPAFALASFYYYYFTGLHLFHYQAILKSFRSFARVIIIIGLTLLYGLTGAIAGYIFAPLVVFVLGIYFDRKTTKQYTLQATSYKLQADTFHWKELLRYAWSLTLFMLFYEFFISIDLYLVKAMLEDDYTTGIYNAALTISRIPYYLFYALAIVLLPALAKMNAESNLEEMKKLLTQSLRYAGIILLPLFIFLCQYAEPVISLLYGQQYLEATALLQVLAFGLSFLTVFYLVCSALNGIGRATTAMWLAFWGLLGNAVLNYYFILELNELGAALATTVSSFLITGISLFYVHQIIPFHISLSGIFKTLLAAVLLWIAASWLPATDWLFIVYSSVLALLYGGLLYAMGILHQEDTKKLRKVFGK